MNFENIFSNIINDMDKIHECFVYKLIKANADKFQFIILGNTGSHVLQINGITVKSTLSVMLLSIITGSKQSKLIVKEYNKIRQNFAKGII